MKKKSFAIIGNPITHSLSPVLHNYWFKKYNIEANYSLLDVNEENLINVIKKIRDKEISGVNVTLPYKQKIIPFLDKVVNDAQHTMQVLASNIEAKLRLALSVAGCSAPIV